MHSDRMSKLEKMLGSVGDLREKIEREMTTLTRGSRRDTAWFAEVQVMAGMAEERDSGEARVAGYAEGQASVDLVGNDPNISLPSNEDLYLDLKVENLSLSGLIDTGSSVRIIHTKKFDLLPMSEKLCHLQDAFFQWLMEVQ